MSQAVLPLPIPPPAAHLSIARAAAPDYVAAYVEGPTDAEMWRHWLRWPPQVAGGKHTVLSAIAELEQVALTGFLGIIDADVDHIQGVVHSPNIVSSEFHDLECDLLHCPALERLVSSLDPGVVATAVAPHASLGEALTARGRVYGYARWVFRTRQIEYPGGRLSPFRFTDHPAWSVREDDLYSEAAAVLNLGKSQFIGEVDKLKALHADDWQVCNGHDLVSLLTILLQGTLNQKRKFPSDDVTASMLRMCIDHAQVRQLHIAKEIEAWQARNLPFVALRPL